MKTVHLIIFYFLSIVVIYAQPKPCGNPAFMTSFCSQACVICDIDGFKGNNNSSIVGEAPPGFCTIIKHHLQWIAFVAGTENLTLSVKPTNCKTGQGLEIGIYKSLDCKTYQLVSNCNTDLFGNTTGLFTNTVPLIVGQYYYFVMDGNDGDVCDYVINVVDGSTKAPPIIAPTIYGTYDPCLGTTGTYTMDVPPGATNLKWTLDGVDVGTGSSINLSWLTPGDYVLCANGSNVCEEGPPTCVDIHVQTVDPTLIVQTICEGDCFTVNDTILCDAGTYSLHAVSAGGCDSLIQVELTVLPIAINDMSLTICDGDSVAVGTKVYKTTGFYKETLTGPNGCDSLISLDLTVLPVFKKNLSYTICDGDSVMIGSNAYKTSGNYTEILTAYNGCDSIINLDLKIIICEIKGSIGANNVKCFGDKNGTLTFSVEDGTPIFNYNWYKVGDPGVKGSGVINNLNQQIIVPGLGEGDYVVTIVDQFGNDVVLQGFIKSPSALKGTLANSDFNGSSVSCNGSSDGTVISDVSGGTPPFTYSWSNGSNTSINQNLKAGNYILTITDANNCQIILNTLLTEPLPLEVEISAKNPDCNGKNTGIIKVEKSAGGIPPYEYKLNALSKDTSTTYTQLLPGDYVLTIADKNGCTQIASTNLAVPLIPEIELGPDVTIDLGESIILQSYGNEFIQSYRWPVNMGLSCDTCDSPIANPYNSTLYILNVSSSTGCFDQDSIYVYVLKNRRVYVPNAFSPNGDGINDKITVFAGPEVEEIESFQIYSRWGELVFKQTKFPPNQLSYGWDGYLNGKAFNPATFVWYAEVKFLDGVTTIYKGGLNLMK